MPIARDITGPITRNIPSSPTYGGRGPAPYQFAFAGDGHIATTYTLDSAKKTTITFDIIVTSSLVNTDPIGHSSHYVRLRGVENDLRLTVSPNNELAIDLTFTDNVEHSMYFDSIASGNVDIKLDGVASGETLTAGTGGSSAMYIANNAAGGSAPLQGIIKNVRVYEANILVAHWPIDDNSNVITDIVGGFNGTLTPGTGVWEARTGN